MKQANHPPQFMVVRNGRSFGPFMASHLRQFAIDNRFRGDDYVCRVGSGKKSRVRKIASLCDLLQANQDRERKNDLSRHRMVAQDSVASHAAILSYNQWKANRSGNPDEAFQKKALFRTEEFLKHGEFDLKMFQPISGFSDVAKMDR